MEGNDSNNFLCQNHQRCKPELKELLRYSGHMATCWKHIALELDIPCEVVEKIDIERSTISDKCFSIFSTWMKSFTNDRLCWCQIVNAFKLAGLVDVAKKINDAHLSFSPTNISYATASGIDTFSSGDNRVESSSTIIKLRDHFCNFYKRIRYVPEESEWPPNQSKVVVNVTLMHNKSGSVMPRIHKNAIENNPNLFDCDGPSAKRLCLDGHKITEQIVDIFRADEMEGGYCELPRCILIEGAPGTGKTVLAKEIAYHWAVGKLLDYVKILFLLFLRDPRLREIYKAEDLIEYATVNHGLSKDEVQSCTAQLVNAKIGIVLDGLDEYDSKNNSFFIDVIAGKIFLNAVVVCTSRPTVTLNLHSFVDRRIEILGLPEEERNKYIELSLAGSPGKKEELDKYLTRNPIIKSLCCVPLHLAILLYLFKQGSLPETLTEINESFIVHTIYRNLEKNNILVETVVDKLINLPKDICDFVCKLSKLAYSGLNEHKIVFPFDKVKEICHNVMDMPGAVNGFGLLQAVQHYPEDGAGMTMSFNFLHFTMQEFLAAHYISTLSPNEKQLSLMKETFWDEHYRFMWMMYVGIVEANSDVFLKFIDSEILGNIQECKMKSLFLLQCCSEAKSNQIPEKISSLFDSKIEFNCVNFYSYTFWSVISFMYKSDKQTQYSTLDFNFCFLDSEKINLLYYFVIDNPEKTSTLEYVNINSSNVSPWNVFCAVIRHSLVRNLILCGGHSFTDYHTKELATSLNNKLTLNSLTLLFCGHKLRLSELRSIKNILTNANTSLQELNLSWENLDISKKKLKQKKVLCTTKVYNCTAHHDININVLHDHTKNCTDCSLDLSCLCLTNDKIIILSFGLEGRNNITKLDISGNYLNDDGVEAIMNCLLINNTLQELNISGCNISGESIAKIIDASRNLHVLNVSNNNLNKLNADNINTYTIDNYALEEMCEACKGSMLIAEAISKNTSLQELDISHNDLQDYGSIAIEEKLKFNKTLQHLNMSANKITNIGAAGIAHALYVCTALCELNISENRITYEGVISFLDHVQVNSTLKTLWITHNNITKTGFLYIENYIKKICSSFVIHTSWNEIVKSYKHIVLKVNYVSLNTGTSTDTVVHSHDCNIRLFENLVDQNYGNVLLSDCLKDNDTLQEFDLSHTNINIPTDETKRIIEVLKFNKTLVKLNFHIATCQLMQLWPSVTV